MDREPSLQISWLNGIGFSLGNPFTTREASGEPSSALVQYFVLRPGFADIVGSAMHPRSALLCAGRGAGKTTSRLALELQCRAGQMDAPVLPVTYADFDGPLSAAGAPQEVTTDDHLVEILGLGLRALFDALADRPANTASLVGGLRRLLALNLFRYTNLLEDIGLDEWLAGRQLLSERCQAKTLERGAIPPGNPFLAFVSELLGESKGLPVSSESPVESFASFLRLAQSAGFEAVYFLIDRVDEREPMASDPDQAAALLAPLVSNLVLMDKPHAAFKFFITPEVLTSLSKRLANAFRPDRLVVRDISWDENSLKEMLDRRVSVFSDDLLPSLNAVSETGDVVGSLAAAADGSPRNLLRLAEWLLFWQHQRAGSSLSFTLTADDVSHAIKSFDREREVFENSPVDSPVETSDDDKIIRIDEADVVWVGKQRIGPLPKLRFRLLSYLLANENQVLSYEQIGKSVYGEDWTLKGLTNDSIDGLVKHVRAALKPSRQASGVIRKVSDERGYVFRQPR